ncbi:helix-turn-helix domain-containing protein [Deinococcus detaillensis]|uniref:Helix-turn-helix domain-containing protein n=1 Tax=Deinococcus detaillensis TaxID=2592048 RepID=A0A553UK61_9DEIO|nr:helix-turn-helix domain-containing protein [Deinococcus detaillensis]TSA80588.1 helix-turn-helix domain-containing protein [Deinococcus detaillensis]
MTQRQFYTPDELAAFLRLSGETIRRRLRTGETKGLRIGDTWRVPRTEVLELIGAQPLAALDAQLDERHE